MPNIMIKMPNYACCVQAFTRTFANYAPKMVDMCLSLVEQAAGRLDYTIMRVSSVMMVSSNLIVVVGEAESVPNSRNESSPLL